MLSVRSIINIVIFICPFSWACHAEVFGLNDGQPIVCEPSISRDGKFAAYCGKTDEHVPTASWEILPRSLNSTAAFTPSSLRIFEPVTDPAVPFPTTTSGVLVNSRGFGIWLNISGWPSEFFHRFTRSPFGWAAIAERFSGWPAMDNDAEDVNDFDEITGSSGTPDTLRRTAVIFNASGLSRRLPIPAEVRGSSSGTSINNSGLIGGYMVYLTIREALIRTEPHACLWVPTEPALPKGASYSQMPVDLHPSFSHYTSLIGSSVLAIGPTRNPWIGGTVTVQERSGRHRNERVWGFVRHGISRDAEQSILSGDACKLVDPVNPALEDRNCIESTVVGVNDQYAVGNATYELPGGGQIDVPFYLPLSLLGEGIYDLNAHLPSGGPWQNLSIATGLSENGTVIGIGYFHSDSAFGYGTWRGFALQL